MADPVVHITNGIPDLGTGNITTLGLTIAAQAQAISGQAGPLVQGSVSTGAPVYTTGTINPLSLDGSGNLRTLISNASIPVTGTVTANQGGSWAVNISQFGGGAVVTGTGIGGAGIPRVTVSSDSSLAATQSGTWNITNVSGTISLPTGAATAAKQPALGTAGVPSADVISVQGIAGGTAQPVSIAAAVTVAQPTAANLNATVTGTVAVSGTSAVKPDGTVWTLTGSSANVNVSNTVNVSAAQSGNWTTRIVGNTGAIVDAAQNAAAPANTLVVGGIYNSTQPTITTGNACQLQTDANGNLRVNIMAGAGSGGTASTVGGAVPGQGTLALGSVTTAAPSYTTATANSLSLTTSGNLRVDGSSVTQPVSGTVSISGTVPVSGTFWQTTQPVSGTFWQATQPVSIAAAVTVAQATAANLNATVTGTVAISGTPNVNVTNASLAVTGTFWQATQPVSGTVTANLGTIAGVATSANQPTNVTQGTSTTSQTGTLGFGAVTSAAPTYTTAQSNPLSLTTAGALRVDGSGVTQPVSGTVTANQGGTWSTRTQDGSGNAITSTSGALDINIKSGGGSGGTASSFGATFPASGTAAGAEYLSSPPTLTTGQMVALQTDVNGNLKVNIVSGAGSGGTAMADEAAFTAGTTSFTPAGGFFQTTATSNALTTGQAGAWQMTANRAGFVNLRNASGTEIGTSTTPLRDAPDGTIWTLTGTSANMNVTNTVPVSGTFWQATQPVSGTVTVTQGTAANLNATVTGTVAATQSGTWTVQQGTPPWSIKPDGTTWGLTSTSANVFVSNATVAVTQSGNFTTRVVGNSGAAIDGVIGNATAPANMIATGGVFNTTKPTLTTGQSAAFQSNSSGIQLVDGTGGTFPVSGSVGITGTAAVTQSGTWTVQPGNTANTTAWLVTGTGGTFPVTGTFWQATQPVSIAATVNVSAAQSGNWTSRCVGNAGAIFDFASTQNIATPANAILTGGEFNTSPTTITSGNSSPLQLNATGSLRVDGSLVTQPVSIAAAVNVNATQTGTWTVQPGNTANTTPWLTTINQGGNSANVNVSGQLSVVAAQTGSWTNIAIGNVGAGVADSGNPVKIGAVAQTTNPTAVTSGQRSNCITDKLGKLIAVGAIRELKGKTKNTITTGSAVSVIAAAGAGVFTDVYAIVITNTSTTSTFVDINDGTAVVMTLAAPASDTRGFTVAVDSALPQATANSAWTATVRTAVSSIEITMLYVSNL